MGRQFWNAPGRVKTGWGNELDLERTRLDGETGEHVGGDPDSGISEGKTFIHDTRGDVRYVSGEKSGLGLGYNGVDFTKAAYQMASASYIESKERWRCMSEEEKEREYFLRRQQRASRSDEDVRRDSINRKSRPIYKQFVAEREEGWNFGDPEDIARMDAIDSVSAYQIAEQWRREEDQRKLDALVVRYAAWLEDKDPKLIRQRFRRNGDHRDKAEYVFVNDALATGILFAGSFNEATLRAEHGGELVMELVTPRSDAERRDWLITEAGKFYRTGAVFPPYIFNAIGPLVTDVVAILEEAGVDLMPPPEWDEALA